MDDRDPGYNANGKVVYTMKEVHDEINKMFESDRHTNKRNTISAAVTDVQKERMKAICKRLNISSSDFIRAAIDIYYEKEFKH